jgi:hypothetical protein
MEELIEELLQEKNNYNLAINNQVREVALSSIFTAIGAIEERRAALPIFGQGCRRNQ